MKIELDANEQRVIGCLIEKQITTPDQYPLSLNALVNACNQKSNRDPMLNLTETEVLRTVEALSRKHLIVERSGFGSRVPKYQHRFCNTEYGTLKFIDTELAIICELLLRGPQTPGELKTRASRMAPIDDVSQVDAALNTLSTREDGPFVVRLARQAGRRDSQWAHLLGTTKPTNVDIGNEHAETLPNTLSIAPAAASKQASSSLPSRDDRITQLEQEVKALRAEIEEIKHLLLSEKS